MPVPSLRTRFRSSEQQPLRLAAYLDPLLDHPNSNNRDPEFVLRALEDRRASRWPTVMKAVARDALRWRREPRAAPAK